MSAELEIPTELSGANQSGSGDVRPGVLYVLFLLSGLAGLIYEVMWMRSFSLVFGSTNRAAAAVLASFFGGLALGSLLGARLANRRSASLWRYGVAEIAVAGGALLVEVWLGVFREAYSTLYQSSLGSGWTMTACKLLLAFVAMGLPCVAMGTTLPLITRAIVTAPGHLGRRVGVAYALNTLGATTGVLLAGFVLPPVIGTTNSVYLAVAVNLLIGVAAIWLSLRARRSMALADAAEAAEASPPAQRADKGLLLVVAVSGFGTLALEVLYTRLIVNVTDSSVFSFALMLAMFLVCLAVASLLVSWWIDRAGSPWRFLAWTQSLALVAILVSPAVFQWTYDQSLKQAAPGFLLAYLWRLVERLVWVVGPTVLLVGVALPTAWKIATRQAAESGRKVGRLTGLNTLAAVAGSVGAGFFIVPLVGIGRGFALVAALYGVVAVLGWLRGYGRKQAVAGGVVLAAVSVGLYASKTWYAFPLLLRPGERVVYFDEGESACVAVVENTAGTRFMRVNNHYLLGGSGADAVQVQRAQGGLPLLLHPAPKSAAFIGVATGVSVSSILDFPIERVTAIELIPEVLDATVWFEEANRGVLHDPRVRAVVADGRNYLFATDEQFDVIVGDLFIPWHAGTGYLYTTEHFRDVAERLTEGGVFAQWLSTKQMSVAEFRTITATFLDVFPTTALWLRSPAEGSSIPPMLALVGHAGGPPDADSRAAVAGSAVFPHLEHVCGPRSLLMWSSSALRNSDEFPRIEFVAAANHFRPQNHLRQVMRVVEELKDRG